MAKVKIQGHASGTGILTVTAPNTSTDRTITLPDSTGTLVDNTTAVTKDASGNVGIGVTPETDIPSLYKALQINGAGSIYAKESGTDCRLHLSSNASMNSSYDDKYIKSSVNSSTYIQSAGTHTFQTAASGSADAAITWTTGFEVLNDGKARAKNGLLFGTDTAASNTLDDYEEGTWTPVLADASGNAIAGSQSGFYTKIGRAVHFEFNLNVGSHSGTTGGNEAQVNGLPFAVANTIYSPHTTSCGSMASNVGDCVIFQIFPSTSYGRFYKDNWNTSSHVSVKIQDFGTSGFVRCSGTYYTT